MSLEIKYIKDGGDLSKERIVFAPRKKLQLGEYMILRTIASGGDPTTGILDMFWFPDAVVGKNDTIVLYTKTGKKRIKEHNDEEKTHFYYWGLPEPIWGEKGFSAVVVFASAWSALATSDDRVSFYQSDLSEV